MIKKPSNWDAVEVMEFDFTPIELGAHKGIIMKAEEYTSPQSGKTSLKVSVDTSKDDKQPEYFAEQYKNDVRIDRKWSNSAIKYVPIGEEESQVKMLKAFITAYENSNNCKFDWNKDWEQLKGKKIILFAPTYRGTNLKVANYEFDKLDLDLLYKKLSKDYVFVFKWHPAIYNNMQLNILERYDFSKW